MKQKREQCFTIAYFNNFTILNIPTVSQGNLFPSAAPLVSLSACKRGKVVEGVEGVAWHPLAWPVISCRFVIIKEAAAALPTSPIDFAYV